MRRQALQDYLRAIVKITGLCLKSLVISVFLELEINEATLRYETLPFGHKGRHAGRGSISDVHMYPADEHKEDKQITDIGRKSI